MYYPNGVIPEQNFSEGVYVDYRHFDKVLNLRCELWVDTNYHSSLGWNRDTSLDTGFHTQPSASPTSQQR